MDSRGFRAEQDRAEELEEKIASLEIFDAEAWLGKTSFFPLMDEGTPGYLNRQKERHGMRGMMVSHWPHGRYTPRESNERLLEQIAGYPDCHAVLTALPLFPEDRWFVDSPKVKAVRVYPSTFSFSLSDWCIGSLCGILAEKRIPLLIFHTEADFKDIYTLAKKYPEIKIVIESQPKKIIYQARQVLSAMKECGNIYLEISNWHGPGLLEYAARNIGSGRLIFGSFMPANDPLVPIGSVVYSGLPGIDKKQIAGGNMREIISACKQ